MQDKPFCTGIIDITKRFNVKSYLIKTIKGLSRADSITFTESNVTVNADLGNDTITVGDGSSNNIP